MEKLQINTGGQPVVLEDLALLQDSPRKIFAALLSALTGGVDVVLLGEVSRLVQESTSTTDTLALSDGTLMIGGELYPFAAQVIQIPTGTEPYICLKEEDGDFRTFDNNQIHPTRKALSAFFSAEPAGVKSWKLNDLQTLQDAMAAAGKGAGIWVYNPGSNFENGYKGYFRMRYLKSGDAEFEVNLSSALTEAVKPGVVCELPPLWRLPENHRTQYFKTLDGYEVCLASWAADSYLHIFTREYIEGKSNKPMIRNIYYKWKLSEMIEWERNLQS